MVEISLSGSGEGLGGEIPAEATLHASSPVMRREEQEDLRAALDAVLSGKPVEGLQARSVRCAIKWKRHSVG